MKEIIMVIWISAAIGSYATKDPDTFFWAFIGTIIIGLGWCLRWLGS